MARLSFDGLKTRATSLLVSLVLLSQLAACSTGASPASSVDASPPSSPTAAIQGEPVATKAPEATDKPLPPAATATPLPPTSTPKPSVKIPSGLPDAGIQVFLWGNAPTTERDLGLAKEAGFTWVKERFEWRYIEPHEKGQYEWAEADRIVDAVQAAGLKLVIRVDNQPAWARADNLFPGSGPPDNLADFTDFLQALATRYKGRIAAYEIWNEPNLAAEWGNRAPNANEYVAMLKQAYEVIKQADPQALVISAGLAPTTASGDVATPDAEFVKQMYAAGAKGYFDLLGVHAAGYKAAPEMSPEDVAADDAYNHLEGAAGRIYCFRHAEDIRQVMIENGDSATKMAIMEFGWTTDDRPNSLYHWHAVTPEEQADYLVRAFKYARRNWSDDVALMSLIYIADPHWTKDQEQYYWSITEPDGTPRPAYHALLAALR